MAVKNTLLLLLLASTNSLFSADNQLKNSKKIPETVTPIKPSACYAVLACMRTINPKKACIELLTENFWSSSETFFSLKNRTEWTPEMLKIIDKTLPLVKIFCAQTTEQNPDWDHLHESLADLSPEKKLDIINFAEYLQVPTKLLTIIAHSLKNDITKKKSCYKKLQNLETCTFDLTTTPWKKIGVYTGTKNPVANNIFTSQNILEIPLKDGILSINPISGEQTTIFKKEKKNKKTDQKTVKKSSDLVTFILRRGGYSIDVQKHTITINNKKFWCSKPHKQICLTARFFAFVENLEGWEKNSMRARLINFEQNRDEPLNVRRSCDSSMFGSDLYYSDTKIRHTNNMVFGKGRSKIDAVDLTSGAHTTFRSDYTIRDIFLSPDQQHIAICEDLTNQRYSYHLFKLIPEKLPLKAYLKPTPLPTTDLYGTSWTPIVDTAKSVIKNLWFWFGYK